MRLDRNMSADGTCKYAVVRLRDLPDTPTARQALKTLEGAGVLDYGRPHQPDEFFLIRLKDKYARPALLNYAAMAFEDDPEYSREVQALADRSGSRSPFCKRPD